MSDCQPTQLPRGQQVHVPTWNLDGRVTSVEDGLALVELRDDLGAYSRAVAVGDLVVRS